MYDKMERYLYLHHYIATVSSDKLYNIQVLKKLVQFLTSEETLVRARSVGVIHNLSVDGVAISLIVESGCTPLLVSLLRDSSAEICRSAAGTIQNLSRDTHARQLIVDAGVVEHISDLLFASDVPCQVS